MVCEGGVNIQLGLMITCSSLQELLHVYPAGVPSLPSQSSAGATDVHGKIDPLTRIPFFPSVAEVHGLFGLSLTPSPHLAT